MADANTGGGGGSVINISIPDYTPLLKELLQIAHNATTATLIPAATLSTTGTFGLLTISNTVTSIGTLTVGMVVSGPGVSPGTVVIGPGPNGPSWVGWYVNNAQDLRSRPMYGTSPLVSIASAGIKADMYSWSETLKAYSWYIQDKHSVTPENFSKSEFEKFTVSVNSVTNNLPRFL